MFNLLLVVLGCNISNLLQDRIHTAVHFVQQLNDTNVHWFLSGGIKNPNEDTITEAEKMANEISKYNNIHNIETNKNNWTYIYETQSTNTAENFMMLQHFIDDTNNTDVVYDDLYVVTSQFHYNRAHKFTEELLNVSPKWILGDLELQDSTYWEKIHIRNVHSDIHKAQNNEKLNNLHSQFHFHFQILNNRNI